jgi:predicted Zn-dependent peptidase
MGFLLIALAPLFLWNPDIAVFDLLPDVIELIAQLFFTPAIEADGMLVSRYVEQEQKKLIDAIASLINYPASYAMRRFRTLFARDKDSGAPVSVEQLERTDRQSLAALLQTIQNKARFHVFYIGQTDVQELIALLQTRLLPYLQQTPPTPMPAFSPRCYPAAEQPLYVNETSDAAQSHLIIGYRTDITLTSSYFHAMMLCNELLGGSPVSRLFRHLREEKSLCYSCQSEYYHTRGELVISCGIDREKRKESEDAICEQLHALQTGAFTDRELEDARRLLVNSYIQLTDSTRAIHAYYHTRLLLGVEESLDQCRARCLAVTREDVMLAARSLKMDTVYFLEGTADGEDDAEEDEADV